MSGQASIPCIWTRQRKAHCETEVTSSGLSWTTKTNKTFEELLHLEQRNVSMSILVAEKVGAAAEWRTLQSYWINLSFSSDDYAHISLVLGRSYLSWNSATSFLVYQNKSVLRCFPLSTSPPHRVFSVLMPVPLILFSVTVEKSSIPSTILWQVLLLSCCIYRLVLHKLLALPFLCLSCCCF